MNTPVDPSRRLITIRQACTRASVSRRTIYNWMDGKKVEFVRTASSAIRIYEDTLWRDAHDGRRRVGKTEPPRV